MPAVIRKYAFGLIPLFVFCEFADMFPLFSASLLWQCSSSETSHMQFVYKIIMFPLFMSATFSSLQTGYKHAVHKAAAAWAWFSFELKHGCPIRSKCCTFSWFMVSHLSFYRRVHYFNHEAVLQETDFIISDGRFELPLQSPCYLLKYTVTVQYKIAACFTPFFKILAPLRWDFSSYFETAGGF